MAEPDRRAVLLRFEAGQLERVDRAAGEAGLSRAAYLRAAAVAEPVAAPGVASRLPAVVAGVLPVPLPADVGAELIAFAHLMLSATSGGRFELHFAPGGDLVGWKAERSGKVERSR
jgi:hypothetical protein